MLVWSVVATLKQWHGGSIHIVPGTSGRIDQEEARGYLLGAVLGRGLLPRKHSAPQQAMGTRHHAHATRTDGPRIRLHLAAPAAG